MQRLSSGLRINSAVDDAAGLAISERMTTQVRGLNQAVRNANDGISLLQTSDGALTSVAQSLQRIRELAVQAAHSTNSDADRAALQQEIAQLTQEIDRVGRTTTFNGREVFAQTTESAVGDPDELAVLDGLRSGWLTAAENLVRDHFGIEASGQSTKIELTSITDGEGSTLARVTGLTGSSGPASNITLLVDMADIVPANPPNGGNAPVYNDRVLAHEMTHAVMFAPMNVGHMFTNNQQFFLEGSAELIHGANASGGPTKTAESVVVNVATRSGEDQLSGFEETWEKVAAASSAGPTQSLQIGADVGQTLAIGSFAMNGAALDILDADVTADANRVIAKTDRALE